MADVLTPSTSFNPIEIAFSKVKTFIRNSYTTSVAARDRRHRNDRELIQAIVDGCASLTASDLAGYFRERGTMQSFQKYYPNVQL